MKAWIFKRDITHFMPSHCVKSVRIRRYSGPHFPTFGLNTERYPVSLRIQAECGKVRTRITTDTFHAVSTLLLSYFLELISSYSASILQQYSLGYSKPCQTSKMERFAKTFMAKNSIFLEILWFFWWFQRGGGEWVESD